MSVASRQPKAETALRLQLSAVVRTGPPEGLIMAIVASQKAKVEAMVCTKVYGSELRTYTVPPFAPDERMLCALQQQPRRKS